MVNKARIELSASRAMAERTMASLSRVNLVYKQRTHSLDLYTLFVIAWEGSRSCSFLFLLGLYVTSSGSSLCIHLFRCSRWLSIA